jgi:outer membrane lipoprotein carrier protein
MCNFLCWYLLASLSAGSSTSVRDVVAQVEARYRSATTMQATFLERYSENGRVVRVEAGTAYFRRPGKMRWEYESPEKNLFLVDGKTAWFYVPADHTVTRVPAKESADWRTPLALLAGEMKVSRVCARVELATTEKAESADHAMLQCTLRGDASKESQAAEATGPSPGSGPQEAVFFEIARDTGDLVRILVRERGGIQVEFRFTNWRMNPPLADGFFRFEPAPGVAIVNGELPAGNAAVKP